MNARTDPSVLAATQPFFARLPSGACMPYAICGAGEPLVFVHGSLCDYRYWHGQASVLSKDFLCVSVSLGHYWPGSDAGVTSEFGWRSHVAELAEFIDAMGIAPVHLAGHSRGACVAFQLARAYPHLVRTLTLADPGGPLQAEARPQAALPPATQALRARAAALIDAGEIDAGLELFVDSVSMPGYWRRSPSGFRAMAIDNAHTLPMQFRETLPAYSCAAAAEVRCPTLLVEGEKSPRMYRNNVDKLAGWIAHAEKHTVAGASHGMTVTHPAAFNRLLRAFLGKPLA